MPCNASEKRWTQWSYHLTNVTKHSCSWTARQMPCASMFLLTSSVLCSCTPFHQSISVDCFSCAYTLNKPHLPENSRPRYHKSFPLQFCLIPILHLGDQEIGCCYLMHKMQSGGLPYYSYSRWIHLVGCMSSFSCSLKIVPTTIYKHCVLLMYMCLHM